MGKLTMTTFLTLDGVMQGPGGPTEDRSGNFQLGGWLVPFADQDMAKLVARWFREADAFLLGRGTYEIFANYWPRVKDPTDVVASTLNEKPKYVVSRRLENAEWKETRVIRDVGAGVADLKRRYQREIQVHGSAGLASTLLEQGLVDEYRLWQFPVILGQGKRLFSQGAMPSTFQLMESSTTSKGVVVSVYRPSGRLTAGSFGFY